MPWAFAALRRILYHGDTASRIAAWAELDGPKWKGRPPQSYPVSGQKGHILGGNREEKP
jgi:hypothetical protein